MNDDKLNTYLARVKKLKDKIDLDQNVYQLNGLDILAVLEDRGWLEKMTDEQVGQAINFIDNDMEIPWTDYVEGSLYWCDDLASIIHANRG